MSIPSLSTTPRYVRASSDRVVVPFPGEGMASWQVGALLGGLSLLIAAAPTMAALGGILAPAAYGYLRSRHAPMVEVTHHTLKVVHGAQVWHVQRDDVLGASVRRGERGWQLDIDTHGGRIEVCDTGGTPADLQWLARLVEAWVKRKRHGPRHLDAAVIDEGLGVTSLGFRTPWSPGDIAVFTALMVALLTALIASLTSGIGIQLAALMFTPLAVVLGHLVGSRISGRTEVQVREQSVLVTTTQPRARRHTLALADIERVDGAKHAAVVHLRDGGRVRIPARSGGLELADTLQSACRRLTSDPHADEQAAHARAALAQMVARTRE